ncbi:DUF1513 domain-containing protein [Rhizobium sp. RU20A]|uniref:DUF1513 domain-containing protein n=1 Tax=Rhizobium sp. RU20A TaxID=1907412 RepID=UPI00122D0449|nr:DUF1513 domain-containing protein [Rhizobium sp. RU20A]
MPVKSLLERRSFLKMAGAAWALGLAPQGTEALARAEAVYASAFMDRSGAYGIATISERGEIIERVGLPARAHGLAASADGSRAVAFARRPGTFALVFSPDRRFAPVTISAAEGRHFFGHGCFSADGRLLYATENDFDANRGMIGVYDGTDGYRRIGEFQTFGIGPHDMTMSGDGTLLAVANGGIETHPDFGRTKLNLDHMDPSLSLIDATSGALIERHTLPASLKALSTRHLDIDAAGRIWFACQWEGARDAAPPLAGSFRRGEDLTFLSLPEDTTARLANYIGAVAIDRQRDLVGLTSPIGNSFVVVDAKSSRVLSETSVDQVAGIAAGPQDFAVSDYRGGFAGKSSPVAWDQHIVRL